MSFNRKLSLILVAFVLLELTLVESFWPWDKEAGKHSNKNLKCGQFIENSNKKPFKDRTGLGEAPFLVFIEGESQYGTYNCSGVIMNTKTVLTSQKCRGKGDCLKLRAGYNNIYHSASFNISDDHNKCTVATEPGECGRKDLINHGLAEIKSQFHFGFNKKENGLKDPTYLNEVCIDPTYNSKDIHRDFSGDKNKLYLFSWVPEDNCPKKIAVTLTECVPNHPGNPVNIDNMLCIEAYSSLPGGEVYNRTDFQEGAPVAYLKGGSWYLFGIVSHQVENFFESPGACMHDNHKTVRIIPMVLETVKKMCH